MIAIDTNVVVRVLTNDDPAQASAAATLLEREIVFLSVSVVLETEWVLRSVYGLHREAVARSLRRFLGVPTVTAESAGRVGQALSWYEEGLDFADALHLASATEAGAERLATFDGTFRRQAEAKGTAVSVITP
ncbi:MAG: type II toxin-antitoxin system VapC family toxin [Gammaproteobacteria bacterium]|nr:type II toxin-antitoxin system VapC family toxin [Gammaproteobacteria bacterium]